MMEKTGMGLMLGGLVFIIAAEKDWFSIMMNSLEIFFMNDFHSPFLGSFGFRLSMMILGGIFLLLGGFIYRKYSKG